MSIWMLGASFRGDYAGGYIQAQGGDHGFYRRASASPYGWGGGWGVGPHRGGGYGVGIGFNIGPLFSRLFQGGPPAANQPVYYDSAPPVADGYQRGRTLDGSAWGTYQHETSGPELPPGVTAVRMRYMPAGEPPKWRAKQQEITGVDLMKNPELTLNAGDVTRQAELTISSAPAANEPNWQRAVYEGHMGIRGVHIGNG